MRTNQSVLRGYAQDAFSGRRFAVANLEYRIPLAHPQRGLRRLPVFVRHLHAGVFVDAADAWAREFQLGDVKTAVGVQLGTDVVLGHGLPLTFTVGLAQGLAAQGTTQAYLRTGLAF